MQFPRAVGFSLAGHAALLVLLFFSGAFRGCTRKPPGESIVMMEVIPEPAPPTPAPPEPTPPVPEPPEPPKPEPVIEEIPDPIPDLMPKPKPKPKEPPKLKPKIEKSKTRITKPPVNTTKPLTQQQIRDRMSKGLPATRAGSPSDFPTWYFDYVRSTLYDLWIQPSGVAATSGLSVEVVFRVHRDGSVSRKTITRRSGNAALDQSVQSLCDTPIRFKPLPETYRGAHRDITISFSLTGL